MPAVQPRPTLADVARLAGVSAKTVSRVYADPDTVSPQTAAKVRAAAERLNFRPNLLARDLRRGGVSQTVAFVTSEFVNPFYIQVAAGIERECAQHGFTMVLASSDDARREQQVIDTLVAQRVGAVLFVPLGDDHSYLEGERRLGTAIVAIDAPARNLLADSVVLANREGAYLATKALLDHGHRRIGYVCNPVNVYTQAERLEGYRQALAEAGLPADDRLVRATDDPGVPLDNLVDHLLDSSEPPTALIGGNNRATVGAVRVTRLRKADVALIGFDDFEMADIFNISVIAHDPVAMGHAAARLALDRLDDPTGITHHVELPVHYVPRGSAERPPAVPV
ncbi:MAG: LacI family DNA-binding transcriptional regulator [Propionicimonas sp.]|uniref:LacI family DNA-binding transcriptional regulator n=1 Tax=Propionicimonas sp. TaxID=1955623 RepID=UPI002B2137CF|nr:LacI family DNA-binding transcriptional regulator [Propionicimonas sp.]MEA4944562.1 LacI family DNA-binding transcriptional regulator [Propionicimonas sp.]MEA5116573.1 LacI family DNA-binding transcriptional regulator [Propionicimonas sp.]